MSSSKQCLIWVCNLCMQYENLWKESKPRLLDVKPTPYLWATGMLVLTNNCLGKTIWSKSWTCRRDTEYLRGADFALTSERTFWRLESWRNRFPLRPWISFILAVIWWIILVKSLGWMLRTPSTTRRMTLSICSGRELFVGAAYPFQLFRISSRLFP